MGNFLRRTTMVNKSEQPNSIYIKIEITSGKINSSICAATAKDGKIFTEFKGDNRELTYLFMEMLRKLEVFKNEN